MIVIKLMEGMGNQMLQYALSRHLSIINSSRVYLDLSWYENKNPNHPREFRLDRFNTDYSLVDINSVIWRLRFTEYLKGFNPFRLKDVKEKNYARYDETVLESGDNILLEGFFPSYKYFENIREVLVNEFTPIVAMNPANEACLQKIKTTNSVSVHFRRGDYALTDFHGMLGKEYYDAAIKLVAEKTGDLQLFIFSDEPAWVEQNMQFNYPHEMISFNNDEHNYFDMELMKHCRHNIIANSSFSWWPAWLNSNPAKIVVSPAKWYKQGEDNSAMIPDGWYTL